LSGWTARLAWAWRHYGTLDGIPDDGVSRLIITQDVDVVTDTITLDLSYRF